MTSQYIPTAVNMVSQVQSIIEGYGMGPLRALAQEPVQNSKDEKSASKTQVRYKLHRRKTADGREYYLLTVTDSGTGGLKGPVLTQTELDDRGYKLNDGENWAAFEGQGFTEKSGGDLGIRGQGKSAFLYHSNPTSMLDDGRERALMLYDTLLGAEEYRLGVRYAKPNDTILSPPLYGDDAKLTIMTEYQVEEGLTVDLDLEPLTQTGARIIVPYLKESAVKAIHEGELQRWLQRCWWRAIQTGDIEITITDEDGSTQAIEVPPWWDGEPWGKGDSRTREYADIPVGDGLMIKRVVLHYDPDMKADEIKGYNTQYGGVQILRGRQWIETLDVRDEVPTEFRGGFRGFAEFDRRLEDELKGSEKPQHESFDGRYQYVSETRQKIRDAVREFAEEQGWTKATQTGNTSRRDQEHAADFLTTFTKRNKKKRDGNNSKSQDVDQDQAYQWQCQLWADFPDPLTTRADWGETIQDVTVKAEVKPIPESRWAKLNLEIKREGESKSTVIRTMNLEFLDENLEKQFGNFQVVKGQAHSGQIQCTEPGRYQLTATLFHLEQKVASATRRIYVETDPPPPPEQRPYLVSISAPNISRSGERRINSGDEIVVKITAKNQTTKNVTLELDASLGNFLLCDGTVIEIPGTPAGETPKIGLGCEEHIRLYATAPPNQPGKVLELEPGRYPIRADLRIKGEDETVAHGSYTIFFEVDPGGTNPDLPFELEAIEEDGSFPMWELYQKPDDQWMLRYHARNPICRELPDTSRNGNKLSGRRSFITEVCASGLLEWALHPMMTGDTSRMDLLKESASDGDGDDPGNLYLDKLKRLEEGYEITRVQEPYQYDKLKRETVADMIHIFEGES